MFGEGWGGGPEPAFGWAGRRHSAEEEAWQPWAGDEEGEPVGGWHGPRHGHHGHHGPRGRAPWGSPGPEFWRGFWGGPPPFGPGAWAWRMARRFPFGLGMGPGGMGPGDRGPRMFGRGDLKYALLDLLRERPKHGYEMIKDMEDRSGGFYTPSAGAIYPTLQLLEDRGWVTVETVEGKKVYAITDGGRAALTEHESRHEESHGPGFRGGPGFRHGRGRGPFGWNISPELGELGRQSFEVAQLMRMAVMESGNDPERLKRLRAIVERAKGELLEFLGQGAPQQPGQGTATGPQGPVEQL